MPRVVDTARKLTPGQERQINTSLGIEPKEDDGRKLSVETAPLTPTSEAVKNTGIPIYRPSIKGKSSLAALTKAAETHLQDVSPYSPSGHVILTTFFEEMDFELTVKYEAYLKRNKMLPPD